MKELYEYKLDLLYYGIAIGDEAYNSLKKGESGKVNNEDYITTKGLMLLLDNQIYVNANLNDESVYKLDVVNNNFVIKQSGKLICDVDVIQPPEFALNNVSLPNGCWITDLVNVHGDRIRIQPIRGCANRCMFCDLNKFCYEEKKIEDLDKAFKYAEDTVGFKHALISGGSPRKNKKSYDYLNDVYKYFGLKYGDKYPIDVMLVPRGLDVLKENEEDYKDFLLQLKSWKIKGIYVNIELYNDELRKKLIPHKELVGKEKYYQFISLAVDIFGKENVKSCIIVGVEDKEDTLKGVEDLCKLGCMPVLSPYVPIDDSILSPSPEDMKYVLERTEKLIDKYDVELGPTCKSCRHNTIHFN